MHLPLCAKHLLIYHRTFQIYKQIVQPFWGLLIDVEDFETKLCIYLDDRSATSRHPATGSKGVSSAWLGMLFAILAVATNYSELPYDKRVSTSQAFGKSSAYPLEIWLIDCSHFSAHIVSLFEIVKLPYSSFFGVASGSFSSRLCSCK